MDKESIRFPHCDPRIIHPPGDCEFCDESGLQQVRELWNMNYTEEVQDDSKLPCPAVKFRGIPSCNAWHGNVAQFKEAFDNFEYSIKKILKKFGKK